MVRSTDLMYPETLTGPKGGQIKGSPSFFIFASVRPYAGGGLGGTRIGSPHQNIKYSGRVDERYVIYKAIVAAMAPYPLKTRPHHRVQNIVT